MLRPLHVTILELKRFLSDRGDLAFSLALPVVLFALIYAAFGSAQTFSSTVNVVDLDNGPAAQELLDRLEAVDGLTVRRYSWEEADRALARSAILLVTVIPEGFSTGLAAGDPVTVTFRQRGNGGDAGQIVASIVQGAVRDLAGEYHVRNVVRAAMSGSGLSAAEIDAVVNRRLDDARANPPVSVTTRSLGERASYLSLLMPGILSMSVLFSVTMAAQSIVTERKNGTFERLLVTRLSVNQLFLGKFLASVCRALLQAGILLALGLVVLAIGSLSTFLLTMLFAVIFAAAVSGVGMVLAALARSRDQGTWMAAVLTQIMSIFGGSYFEPSGVLEIISRFTLNRYANDAFRAILIDGSIADVAMNAVVLAAVALVSLVVARIAFRATEGGR